eukprot:g15059.t1
MAPTRTELLLPANRRDKPISVTAVHETTHAEKVTPAPPHWQVQLGAGDTSHRRRGAQSEAADSQVHRPARARCKGLETPDQAVRASDRDANKVGRNLGSPRVALQRPKGRACGRLVHGKP